MPILTKRGPEWVTEPSVMDPAWQRAAGSVIRTLGLDDPRNTLPTPNAMGSVIETGVGEVAKKVAPRRATTALIDMLMGRSAHVPPEAGLKPITDAEASMKALLESRIGTKPSAPTQITIPYSNKTFKPMTRTLPRAEGITDAYRAQQGIKEGITPVNKRYVNVASPGTELNKAFAGSARTTPVIKEMGSMQAAAKTAGSKVFTKQEIDSLMNGPRKAFEKGIITKEEMGRMLEANQVKIDAQAEVFKKLDTRVYHNSLEKTLNARTNLGDNSYLAPILRAGKAHGATDAELAAAHGITTDVVKSLLSK